MRIHSAAMSDTGTVITEAIMKLFTFM